MAKDLTSSCLDGISKELKSKLIYRTGRVNKHLASAKRSLFDLAEELAGARDDCKAEESETTFGKWADETFGMSRSGAYRFISVYDRIARPYVGAQSDLNFIGFDDYALYDLAHIDTPEAAIKDALKIAKQGGRLTRKEAKVLIQRYVPSSNGNATTTITKPKNPKSKKGTSKPAPAPKTDEPVTVDAESVTPTDPCPNCGSKEWSDDGSGLACVKCSHSYGEALGDEDATIDLPAWAKAKPDVDAFRVAVNALLKSLKDAPKDSGFELIHKHAARIRLDLENAKAALVGCVPHEFCPYCNGLKNDCQPCSNRGWMNKVDYENTPKEIRNEAEKLPSRGGV